MKQRVFKILKITGIAIISLIIILALGIGILFQFVLTPEKITPKVVEAVNKNLNAELSIEAIELTFFKTFPNFKLELENGFILTNNQRVQGVNRPSNDTLISFDYGVVSVNPIAFLSNSIDVTKFSFENPSIYAHVSEEGEVNWNILKQVQEKESLPDEKIKDEQFNANINLEEISIQN